jgi:hypothetical protein
MKRYFIAFLLIVLTLLIPNQTLSIDIEALGSWSLTIDDTYVDGSGIQPRYESRRRQGIVQISNAVGVRWKLSVHRDDTYWREEFVLRLKHHNMVVAVESESQEFLSGQGNRLLFIQFILDNVSLGIPPGIYSTDVVYTVTPL